MATLYAAAATLGSPLLRRMLRRRLARGKEIATRLPERWGEDATPRPPGRLIWLHAASVGEATSLLPLLPLLRPHPVLLTTGTVTSAAMLAQRLPEIDPEGRVTHRFVPLDVPRWVARFLDHWRPDVAGFVESEVWPNLIAGCRARGVRMILLNARLSVRSARGWGRAPGFARAAFGAFARVLAQSDVDAARLIAAGAVHVTAPGNLKFAAGPLPVARGTAEAMRAALGARPIWVAASTHAGEEAMVAAAHARLAPAFPGLLTIIVPRHPERGAAIAAKLHCPRRDMMPECGLWVADTVGELGLFYRVAGVAFVGGSLVPHGGQNPLEASRLGCAVAVGPHTGNFGDVVATLRAAGALATVTDADGLAAWVATMLRDPAARAAMGDAGIAAARGHAELPRVAAAAILGLLR